MLSSLFKSQFCMLSIPAFLMQTTKSVLDFFPTWVALLLHKTFAVHPSLSLYISISFSISLLTYFKALSLSLYSSLSHNMLIATTYRKAFCSPQTSIRFQCSIFNSFATKHMKSKRAEARRETKWNETKSIFGQAHKFRIMCSLWMPTIVYRIASHRIGSDRMNVCMRLYLTAQASSVAVCLCVCVWALGVTVRQPAWLLGMFAL